MAQAWWRDSDYRLFHRLNRERDEQHAEIERLRDENERLKIEREKMYELGYEKGVTDTLLDDGVDL